MKDLESENKEKKSKKAKELSKDDYISHLEQSIESIKSGYQRKLKNKQRALKFCFKDLKVNQIIDLTTSTSYVDSAVTSTPTNSSAKELRATLTPNSKKKARSALKEKNLPGTVKSDIRKDFGLNLSRDVPNNLQNKTNLALVFENFFQRPDVVRICPDVKKKTKNPSNSQEYSLSIGTFKNTS